jgi:hypothetical protein
MESPDLMLPWARSAYAAALRSNAKKQVAGQAQAARKAARQQPVKAARKKTVKKKTAGPAKALRRGKRAG